MVNKDQFVKYMGKPVRFSTPYGIHHGIVERVTDKEVVLVSPQNHVPAQFASEPVNRDSLKQIRPQLAFGGSAPYGAQGAGVYGGAPGVGFGYGYGWGWGRWAVSFLIIYSLFGLFFWW